MESTGELPPAGELNQMLSDGDKLVRPQTPRGSKQKLPEPVEDLKIITIDQLQSESLKGEYHA